MKNKTFTTLLLFTLALCSITSQAQDYLITFDISDVGTYPDSVYVENIATEQSIMLNADDILHLVSSISAIDMPSAANNDINIHPNPMNQSAVLKFHNTCQGIVGISIFNMAGQKVITQNHELPQGECAFSLSDLEEGSYLVSIASSSGCFSTVILASGNANNLPKLTYLTATPDQQNSTTPIQRKATSTIGGQTYEMQYNTGDELKIIAYFSNQTMSVSISPNGDYKVVFSDLEKLTATDIDGNIYGTVQLGNQIWITENMKVTRYPNNEEISISNSTDDVNWKYRSYDVYCFYDDDPNLGYGALYNYNTATNSDNSEYMVQGICPDGWHLPNDDEWTILENYLADNGYNYDGSIGGGSDKIGHALVSQTGWNVGYAAGEIGYDTLASNTSGFSAIPSGTRSNTDGAFEDAGYSTTWWSSTKINYGEAKTRSLSSGNTFISHNIKSRQNGFSVRCLKYAEQNISLPTLTTIAATNVYDSSAVVSGNITNNGGTPLSERGIVYGTSENITIDNGTVITDEQTSLGNFSISLSELPDTSVYYYRAYATNLTGTAYGDELTFTTTKAFIIPPVVYDTIIDISNNMAYKTVTIGMQTWMAENMRATSYADGTAIPHVTGTSSWGNLADNDSTPAYCYYNNDATTDYAYGALYTHSAATRGDTSVIGVQGVCPNGWHLPSNNEWTQLFNYLADNGYNYDGSTGGGNMKISKALSSKTGWEGSGDYGDIGYERERNNASGFSALPAGKRWGSVSSLDFIHINRYAYWWSSSQIADESAFYISLNTNTDHGSFIFGSKSYGHSVRCVKD